MPGLTLKAWARVKADGTLVRGAGVTSVVANQPGLYTVTLAAALAGVGTVRLLAGGYSLLTAAAGTTALGVQFPAQGGGYTPTDFYVEIYE